MMQFAVLFEGMVLEWNLCFSSDGRWWCKCDREIGAHGVDAELDLFGEFVC